MKSTPLPFFVASGLLVITPTAFAHPGNGFDGPAGVQNIAVGPPPAATDSYRKLPVQTPDLSKKPTLYVVGYAHLDTQWRWSYPQVIRQFLPETLHNNFALFEKYPNYVFNFSGSRRYEMMREYYPADYARLKGYVKSGNWFPCGSSVDEGDSVVPSLESLVRHTLYGNRFFQKEFGVQSQEFMLPDCFGFPAALPSIIAHCGLEGFSTQKLTWGSANGIPFKVGNWIGPDGKSVVAALDPGSYSAGISEDLSLSKYWNDRVQANGAKSGVFTDYHYYGVGDRGGAPSEGSVHWVEHAMLGAGPLNVISSPADQMFRNITAPQKKALPNYTGELLLTNHSAGSITSEAYMKRWNRKNELLADAAERASVGAMWLGGAPYPTKKLYDSWDLFLGSQMHDMLPGTSIPKAYEYCWNDEVLAQNGFAAATQSGIGAMAQALDTRGNGIALVVYNPLSTARQDTVEATVRFADMPPQNVRVVGPDGLPVHSQILSRGPNTLKIVFQAKVPSVGLAVFRVQDAGMGMSAPAALLKVTKRTLENTRFRVRFNEAGDVASVFDKKANRETLKAPMYLSFQSETPKQYPAWNMDWEDRKNPPIAYVDGAPTFKIVETGPTRVALQVERTARGSRFTQTVSLDAGGQSVDFDTKIDWQSRGVSLKQSFPLTVSNPMATYDGQLGTLTRGNNEPKKFEVPQHQWFDLTSTDGKYGVAVYNDSKYGSDKPDDSTMRLTLLYTPNTSRGGYSDQGTQDFGRHEMKYSLAPHQGDWRSGNVVWGAARLNQPLRAFQTASHAGPMGASLSLFHTSSGQVSIEAIKKAEDSDEIVIRLQELSGKSAKGFKIAAASPIVAAREINGQEYPVSGAKTSLQNGVLTTDMNGYGLRAFVLKLAAPKMQLAAPKTQSVALPYNLDAISKDSDRGDGGFDEQGRTIAGEELPPIVESEGIKFRTGPQDDDEKNAVSCAGQKIALPKGNWNRVYLLAAADGGRQGRLKIGSVSVTQKFSDWGGYIGSADLRLWDGEQPELTYDWPLDYVGLKPGFVNTDTVAWQASHRHNPTTGNEFYQRSYLFKYGFDLPKDATRITLPNDSKIKVFAVTVARDENAATRAAEPLIDTLEDHRLDQPQFTVADKASDDALPVSIMPALYGQNDQIRYTLDGSTPTTNSPRYQQPIYLSQSATITARTFDVDGSGGPVAADRFIVNDVTAPQIVGVQSDGLTPVLTVRFSEPVDANSAQNAVNYRLSTRDTNIQSVVLDSDGMGATLRLSAPIVSQTDAQLLTKNIADRAAKPNVAAAGERAISLLRPALQLDEPQTFAEPKDSVTVRDVAQVPTDGKAPWTISQWVYLDKPLDELTIISGFGSGKDQSGAQRYLIKLKDSIHFWGSSVDISAKTAFDIGRWQMITVTFDGQKVHIYKDGRELAAENATFSAAQPIVKIAPPSAWDDRGGQFTGKIANFSIWNQALSAEAVAALAKRTPNI